MLEIIKPGLETSIQDFPGRIGYWNQGFPPSGPMDSWSFRLANILVGNDAGAAGLEAQFMGPTIKFRRRDRRHRRQLGAETGRRGNPDVAERRRHRRPDPGDGPGA